MKWSNNKPIFLLNLDLPADFHESFPHRPIPYAHEFQSRSERRPPPSSATRGKQNKI